MRNAASRCGRRVASFVSLSPFRLAAFTLHATGLERIYKPRFLRHSALLELTDEVVAKLPKYSSTLTGGRCDPMNIILVAGEAEIKAAFKQAGWHLANPASPVHVAYALLMTIFGKSYKTGPFSPLYVNISLQDLAFQKSTKENNFRRRHHLRVWRTGIIMPDDKRVWMVAASLDFRMRLAPIVPFLVHDIDSDLDKERRFVVRELTAVGAARLKSVKMADRVDKDKPAHNAFGSKYYTDGRADVVEL